MASEFIRTEKRGRVAIVRFDRGDGRNALSHRALADLIDAARQFEDDTETSVVILTGAARSFSVGYDLKEVKGVDPRAVGLAELRRIASLGPRACAAWEAIEPFTLCAIEGWCLGGGVALAVALDFRVAGAGAQFAVPEIKLGMNMSWQSLPRIVNLVGPARAKEICIWAETLPAATAKEYGLIEEVVPEGAALERALAIAERVAAMPPVAVRMIKQGVNAYATALAKAASSMDLDQFALAQTGADFAEGLNAFLEKRPGKFTGR